MTLNDDNLAYLLSLGFELELCRQALQQNATLEDATEWILDPSQPPTLTASNIHFSHPIFSSRSLPTPNVSLEKNQKNQKDDQETRDSQKKKVDRIADDLRKERLAEREARRRALLDIKEDRERQKRRMRSQPTAMQTSDTSASTTKPAEVRSSDQFASIQFKLTDSKTLRQRFPPDTKLVTLLKLVMENETSNQYATLENISLISTFPKRIYNVQDAALDMREAGFLPNVTLNVNITEPLEMADMMQIEDKRGSNNGRRLGDENEREGGSDQNANIMDIDAISGVDPHRPPVHNLRRVWGRVGTGHQLTDPSPIVNTLETVVEEADAEDITDIRRSNFLMAIEQRASTSSNTLVNQPQPTLERHVKSLRETCSMSVAGLLSQHSSQINIYLKNLKSLSSEVAESLLGYLIKSGKLNASTVRKLADHCYLENIKLDSYTYCTDSLIGDLARSNSTVSITKLSLRGCDVITDNGIRSITGLKNLGCLDVNNCKVTDNGLKSLENLYHLYHLNLSKTKITDQGIASMVENSKFKTNLEVLLLDGCTRVKSSNTLVPIVNGFENLLQLSLANTGIQQQQSNLNLTRSTKLEQLDLTNTFICDNDLIHIISQIRSLVELKMSGCGNVSTRGLSFLPRELKRLRLVQFPDREHELDGVLSRFKELPLEHLDLTSFLNVTDDGAQHIADMKSLRYLSLDGTQLTDAGVELLSDLIELEKLYLDRTLITDSGLSRLLGLSKLETLSLCHTEVSNVFLKLLGDFEQTSFTRNLRTLNLAKCVSVTNKGVRHLSGALNLTNLNLDHTGVNKGCLKYLQDLKYLKPVRLQGISDDADQTDNTDIDS